MVVQVAKVVNKAEMVEAVGNREVAVATTEAAADPEEAETAFSKQYDATWIGYPIGYRIAITVPYLLKTRADSLSEPQFAR